MADSVDNIPSTLDSNSAPFYTSQDRLAGTRKGWIADEDTAHDVAKLENSARKREEELKRQHETGLNEQERKNVELSGVLLEGFPFAFSEHVDEENGEIYYVMGMGAQPQTLRTIENKADCDKLERWFRELSSDQSIRRDSEMIGLLDSSDRRSYPCISKRGIQFGGWGSAEIRSLESLPPHRLDNLLRILAFLNERGKAIQEQLEREKAEMTPEGLRERIQEIKAKAK